MWQRQCLQLSHVLPDAKGVGQLGALGMARTAPAPLRPLLLLAAGQSLGNSWVWSRFHEGAIYCSRANQFGRGAQRTRGLSWASSSL